MNSDQLSKKNTRSKRKCILDGAVQVFTKAGFDAASMDKIAETAGVSKITIYKYFQNKETLFLAVVTEYLKENEAHKPVSYSPSQTIESQLHAFIQAELFRVKDEKQRGMSKLLTSVYLYKTELVKKTMQEHPFFTDFIAWMKMAKQDGK
ncbi:MAG TPA: helix-turn-helix domain-containing protein, partial [Lachnospiraceae bacterium]|nr:helix-turn-helix domain-containing protein [Lachnospiraceae bacterium]